MGNKYERGTSGLRVRQVERAESETPTLYKGQPVRVRHKLGRQGTQDGEGVVYYVSRFGWATVDMGRYCEAFPVSEIEALREPAQMLDEVQAWLRA